MAPTSRSAVTMSPLKTSPHATAAVTPAHSTAAAAAHASGDKKRSEIAFTRIRLSRPGQSSTAKAGLSGTAFEPPVSYCRSTSYNGRTATTSVFMFDALSQRFPGYEDWSIALLPVLLIAYFTPLLI